MPDLVLDNVHKYYGDVHAVRGVSIEVSAGEFVVLVGPSGCGKSTLLRTLAGLEDISAGDIVLNGRSIAALSPKDRNVAMVFQSYALYPYLNAYENIAFGLRARKTSGSEVDRQVRWAAELLDISAYLGRYPRELSGGQRQRVAIGRAIVRDANLFLFDEPLSNLDAKLRDGMREEIKRLHQALRKTFIYVTHDQIEAMTLAERIVLLHDGEIAQSGAPLDLFERPHNTFVAGFLGSPSMNFIEVEVTQDGERLQLPDGQSLALGRAHRELGLQGGRSLIWGVRPEQFGQDGQAENAIDVSMEIVQPTGSRTYGSFTLGGAHAVAELDAHALTRADQKLRLSVAMERTALFDPQNGKALAPDVETNA
ncbi:MAG: ABC transporter ATP-binding protein [Gammaproteobacteria bacterium]